MIGVFLDDERVPSDVTWGVYPQGIVWRIVRNYAEFVTAVTELGKDEFVISFDHDLQDFDADGAEKTGYTCMKMLVDLCIDTGAEIPVCFFHSKNGIGGDNMAGYYHNAVKHFGLRPTKFEDEN
jgi:hypothetical protein